MRIADCGLRIADLFLKPAILCATIVSFIILTGCAREQAIPKGQIIGCDDLGRKIVLPKSPERIVVISGSPVDAIFELGAGERIVAVQDSIARSYPETVRRYPSLLEKPGVGKFSNPNIEKIVSLNPDLIIPYGSSESPGKYTEVFEKRGLPYAAFTTVENVAFGLEQIKLTFNSKIHNTLPLLHLIFEIVTTPLASPISPP